MAKNPTWWIHFWQKGEVKKSTEGRGRVGRSYSEGLVREWMLGNQSHRQKERRNVNTASWCQGWDTGILFQGSTKVFEIGLGEMVVIFRMDWKEVMWRPGTGNAIYHSDDGITQEELQQSSDSTKRGDRPVIKSHMVMWLITPLTAAAHFKRDGNKSFWPNRVCPGGQMFYVIIHESVLMMLTLKLIRKASGDGLQSSCFCSLKKMH